MIQPQAANPQQAKKKRHTILRRKFILAFLVIAFCLYLYNPFKPRPFKTKKRLIILGFDGADPGLLQKWMKQYPDEFPNLRKLMNVGTFKRLKTSYPPESPVAWSCFATGANPGKHGVYDFLRRPAGSYFPSMESFVKKGNPRFLFKQIPIKMPKAIRRRGGTAFWDVLSQKGVRSTLIEVPVTFPPPKLSHGRSLAGLGVPDIRGIQATFHHFVYPKEDQTDTTFGGKVETLVKEGDGYSGHIWGPYDPVVDQERRDKSVEHVETWLEYIEWLTHLKASLNQKFVDKNELSKLADLLNIQVCGQIAYQEYITDDYYDKAQEFEQRIQRLKDYLIGGKPYSKGDGIQASKARENAQRAKVKADRLWKEMGQLSKPIKAKVYFKPVDDQTVEIKVGSESQQVKLNEWSGWFTVSFPILALVSARAVCKFYPQEFSDGMLKVYMTSPDIDPRKPIIPVSHPKSYSSDLAEWLGEPYKTRGWASETHGLVDQRLGEDAFIEDLFFIMDQREKKLFETFERTENNFFISVFSETDRVAHMFYRFLDEGHPMYDPDSAQKYGDVVRKVYARMDAIVGRMMKKIENDPDTTLIVMSDHGFSSWRYQVNLNNWLVKHGYMKLKGSHLESTQKKLDELLKGGRAEYFQGVDWKETRAYALGLGQIYINLEGREPLGIVKKEEYGTLCNEIAGRLQQLKDDREKRGGEQVVAYVKNRKEIWTGPYANDEHDCPDLQVCFNKPYRVSWQTCLGGFSANDVVEDNNEKWSGDHCSIAPEHVPGMFFCNKPIQSDTVSLYDFAPTVIRYFGFAVPKAMEGNDLGIQV